MKLGFSRQIFEKINAQIPNFMKIGWVGTELLHAGRRTDGQIWWSSYCERASKCLNENLFCKTDLLTLNLLTFRICWDTNNASKRQMAFNSAFEVLKCINITPKRRIIKYIIIIPYVCLLSLAFLPGTSLEPAVIPTAQASSFTLQYFPYYVWCSKYSCLL